MTLEGPDIYTIKILESGLSVISPDGQPHFVAPATSKKPKLYVVSQKQSLIYIGATTQSLTNRLRGGMQANGKNGYHGYPWRGLDGELRIDVWYLNGVTEAKISEELETIEAEVVYLFRAQLGQWPSHQTEIHFHSSSDFHREAAQRILDGLNK